MTHGRSDIRAMRRQVRNTASPVISLIMPVQAQSGVFREVSILFPAKSSHWSVWPAISLMTPKPRYRDEPEHTQVKIVSVKSGADLPHS